MFLSRIRILNFRNFSSLDVALGGSVVIVGENRVGKTNFLYAMRLLFDPSLPDSLRQLTRSDFWEGLEEIDADDRIEIFVEIKDFETDLAVLALLTDFRLDDDPSTVRLTYEFRPKAELEESPASDSDFEFVCYGGESETKRYGHDLRRRLTLDLLPALRDAESDLAAWRRSPIRPLVEKAFRAIDQDRLVEIAVSIEETTKKVIEFDEVKDLERSIAELFLKMSGPRQDIKPSLGFSPTDPTRLYRNLRLLIDDGARTISDASLGSANLVFLSLKTLEINQLIEENARAHTLLAIEEPEAHLHPHLQRSVYRHLFGSVSAESPMSVFLTTHSPHIASVAPLRSLVLLKATKHDGTVGYSTAAIDLATDEVADLARYLDVTRAEMLFARGVVLVEGDAERFLLPVSARSLNRSLDDFGVTVCSVAGTNFIPYAKLLTALRIPFAILTDWDVLDGSALPLGWKRSAEIVVSIEMLAAGKAKEIEEELSKISDPNEFCGRCEAYGVFSNQDTLEVDLFKNGDFRPLVASALREGPFGSKRRARIDTWEKNPTTFDREQFLSMVEEIGKGRFAQRIAERVTKEEPLPYIKRAIDFVINRV